MDPMLLREYEAKLADWLAQGYQLMVDDIDGELCVTVVFVAREGATGKEREQEYWPLTPEIERMFADNGVPISKALSGPRPWAGPHPEER